MAGYDSYLQLERALQRLAGLSFESLGEAPGPVDDVSDDLQIFLGPEVAAALADYLDQRIDEWDSQRVGTEL